jgi:HD-GYP domain-containing protein (c-di-GMP phosphodiesterase class II)
VTLEPNLEEQELLAQTIRQTGSRMTARERTAEIVVILAFVAAEAVVWSIDPPHRWPGPSAVLFMGVMVLATRVRFATPFGWAPATQLAFVPLVFALTPSLVPLAAVLTLALARLPEIVSGRVSAGRLVQVVGSAWFAVGPSMVFAVTGISAAHAGPALLLAALAAQFAGDFAASALYFWAERGAGIRIQLRETWIYAVDAALTGVGLVMAQDIHGQPLAVLAVVPLLAVFAMFARERQGRLGNLIELNETYRRTARLLGDVISADDAYTGAHSQGVVGLALAVGEALGLDPERRRNLEFAAQLHDLGKIAIPKEIINKPGALDPEEWDLIKTHTVAGEQMLTRVGGFMRDVGSIVRAHHERWDGQGYPDRVAGRAIPLEARIITACDSWSAMRTDRPYRRALSHEVAVAEMHANSGTQFDPVVVRALLDIVGERPERPRDGVAAYAGRVAAPAAAAPSAAAPA